MGPSNPKNLENAKNDMTPVLGEKNRSEIPVAGEIADIGVKPLNVFAREETSKSKDREILVLNGRQEEEDVRVKKYHEFLSNLITVVRSGIWWDVPYQDLWINEVRLYLPREALLESVVDDFNSSLTKDGDSKFISLKITREKLLKLKTSLLSSSAPESIIVSDLSSDLNMMGDLVSIFFDKNWKHQTEKLESLTFNNVSLRKLEEGGVTKHILKFTRQYQDRSFYLEIFFQGEGFTTQIFSNYVWYKDKEWRTGGYYAPNGTNYWWRTHIGGVQSKAEAMGYNWNDMDTSLSKLFVFLESEPEYFLKWFKVLSKALKDPEASKLFYKSGVMALPQLRESISRTDSWNEQYYKKIHPLARIYYEEFEDANIDLKIDGLVGKQIEGSTPNKFLIGSR